MQWLVSARPWPAEQAVLSVFVLECADIQQVNAFKYMGVVMIAVAFFGVGGQYFPMWGGMFFPARKGYTEEDYYFAEYSVAERERGMHLASSAFVSSLSSSPCSLPPKSLSP